MAWEIQLILIGALMFGALFSGLWIPFALGSLGIVGLIIAGGDRWLSTLGSIAWNNINSMDLTALPLFILMGEILLRTGISKRFFEGAMTWTNRIPGGLLHTNIWASITFSAVAGSTAAAAAAVTTVAVPELDRRGYDRGMIAGTLGAGSLGMLIPPSIMMIVYGVSVQESISRLFVAGIVPGLLAGVLLSLYTIVYSMWRPDANPVPTENFTWRDRLQGLKSMMPVFFLVAVIWGGIYSGVMTPSEVAALSVVVVLGLGLIYRELTWDTIRVALISSVRLSTAILFIVVGAQVLSFYLVASGVNRGLASWMAGLDLGPAGFFAIIVILYLILGAMFDGFSMLFLTLPLLFPVIKSMGFDLIWFGVVFVMLVEIAQITPPFGINLFIINSVAANWPLGVILRGMAPYTAVLLLVVILLWFWPELALWLPERAVGR